MQKIKIIAMGKLTEGYTKSAAAEFSRRISRFYQLTVVEPKVELTPSEPSPAEIDRALSREAERILAEIPPRAAVVAMCVEGKGMSSEELAQFISSSAVSGTSEICFIIGSSHGLHESVKKRASLRLSVSRMTFPHELFRVMLLEQIYRAGEIQSGGKYHK